MARGEKVLDDAAVSVGAALGRLARRLETLNRQRQEVGEELRRAVEHGQRLLGTLGPSGKRAKTGKPPARRQKSSAEMQARKAALAAKRRQAEAERSAVHAHTKTPNERANIRAKTPRRRG